MENDLSLIKSFRSGNNDAFGSLYDRYIKKIYNYIFFKTFHKETAEDLTSKTFLKALDHLKMFDESKGSFSSWLYRIAHNTIVDHYRTHHHESNIDDIWDLQSNDETEAKIDQNKTFSDLRVYLKTLPSEQRDIIILRIWEQRSYREIAEIFNKSESSCKMQFSRTIKKLREEFGDSLLIALLFVVLNRTV